MSKMLVDIAWHVATAAFYKSGGRPWKIAGMRDGVCYIGIVFKQDERAKDPRTAFEKPCFQLVMKVDLIVIVFPSSVKMTWLLSANITSGYVTTCASSP